MVHMQDIRLDDGGSSDVPLNLSSMAICCCSCGLLHGATIRQVCDSLAVLPAASNKHVPLIYVLTGQDVHATEGLEPATL